MSVYQSSKKSLYWELGQHKHAYLVREESVCVLNGQQRVGEPLERLGYYPELIFSHCTKGLLNFYTEPPLLHNTAFREYTHGPWTGFTHIIQQIPV